MTLEGRTVAVVGLGYVGLPTALSFADNGATVMGYDISEDRLADIKSGRVDLLERDHKRLSIHLKEDSLCLTTEPGILEEAEAILVCVPTPIDPYQSPDLRALRGACQTVVEYAAKGQTIVVTSTTYVGCTRDLIVDPLRQRGFTVGEDIFVAFSPERIDPGVEDHSPEGTPRVVGGVTPACTVKANEVLSHTALRIHNVSSPDTAEMTKLVENTFRAVNIALANEFSNVADELGVDVVEVITAAATKPYGFMAFYPGAGVGGHCIPCDPHYLLWQLRARRFDPPLTRTAMTAISLRPREVVAKARAMLAEHGCETAGSHVLVIGVTYKPGVADVRESPALEIIDELLDAGARVAFTDPMVNSLETPHGRRLFNQPQVQTDGWNLILVHTRHPEVDYDWIYDHHTVLDATYRRAKSGKGKRS